MGGSGRIDGLGDGAGVGVTDAPGTLVGTGLAEAIREATRLGPRVGDVIPIPRLSSPLVRLPSGTPASPVSEETTATRIAALARVSETNVAVDRRRFKSRFPSLIAC
jgi:hypothetical protein